MMKRRLILFAIIAFAAIAFAPGKAEAASTVPIYRLYHETTHEHLFTSSANEYNTLEFNADDEKLWTGEGIGWFSPTSGKPIYRLYNKKMNQHLYTTDLHEIKVLTSKHGWRYDNNAKPLFYSGGSIPVYRLYNKKLNGNHHLTTSYAEYKRLPSYGWRQEGIAFYASKTGVGNPRNGEAGYIVAESGYWEVNHFRLKKGVWQWNSDDKTKTYFNTNASNQLPELKKNTQLENIARIRAKELVVKFSHTRPNGQWPNSLEPETGVYLKGENIALLNSNVRSPIDIFQEDDFSYKYQGHRRNMLNTGANAVGIAGYKLADGSTYWVMELGKTE